ncbi:hypothetical protein Vafri_20822, partial [Volvox africanus]
LRCGISFNRGKALAAVGRTAEAEEAYRDTALGAVGLDPNCFAKACAALTRVPEELLGHVRAAVLLVEESGLRQRLLGAPDGGDFRSATGGASPVQRAAAKADMEPLNTAHSPDGGGESGMAMAAEGSGVVEAGGEGGDKSTAKTASSDLPRVGADPFSDRSRGGWLAGIGVAELGWLYFALAKALDG